ncbi:hypothetical protein MOQ_004388 [Trypanosoma cruzi marinkellei]|uniref:Uncharacterized protein n=1 Tax=Trypanosoma cruzi marinkellei TaxID=85056 RepID=K2NS00_TRYCR|nr:hypothetical protein MOQ_004388 [Trypanosoma cruzi marinkellei]
MSTESFEASHNEPVETRGNVYSPPPFSYYVTRKAVDAAEESLSSTSKPGKADQKMETLAGAGEIPPGAAAQPFSSKNVGRFLEQQRYLREINRPHNISLWDQACVGHLFPGMFEGTIDAMELFHLLKMLVMVVINSATVAINVFHETTSVSSLEWTKPMSRVVFLIEFLVVYFFLLFLIVVILHAIACGNVGANLAGDIAALSEKITSFSALRVVAIVSPSFAINNIFPIIQNAMSVSEYLRAAFFFVLWLCACVLATAAVVLKVTQIEFASTLSISSWTIGEFIRLVGLTMNLARVNDSYETETQLLLDAVHRHFCSPGMPKVSFNRVECLYTRICDHLSLPRPKKYEYFDAIFEYHFKLAQEQKNMPLLMKLRKMLNYLAFILRMENAVLRRLLQMSQSPLPFFQMGRDAFFQCFNEQDELGMLVAVWRSDPASLPVKMFGMENKGVFNITYKCEDGRHAWDADNMCHICCQSESEKKFHRDVVDACL